MSWIPSSASRSVRFLGSSPGGDAAGLEKVGEKSPRTVKSCQKTSRSIRRPHLPLTTPLSSKIRTPKSADDAGPLNADSPAAELGDTLDAASIEELLKAANFEDPATVHASVNAEEPADAGG